MMKYLLVILFFVSPIYADSRRGMSIDALLQQSGRSSSAGFQRNSNQKTPEQERSQMLQNLRIDRTNSGILEERMKARREAAEKPEPKPKPKPKEDPKEDDKKGEEKDKKEDKPNRDEVIRQYKADVAKLGSNVVLGEWAEVKTYLESLPDDDARNAYQRILRQLGSATRVSPRSELSTLGAESHSQPQYLRPHEILDLSDTAKKKPDDSAIESIADLMKDIAPLPESFFDSLRKGTRYFGLKDHETRALTAKLLLAAGLVDEATEFIPDEKEARDKKDYASLNLLAQYHAEADQAEKGKTHLPTAWDLCIEIIGQEKAPLDQRGAALYRALALVPRLDGSVGEDWLAQTFSNTSTEGFEILSAVGTLTAQTRKHRSPDYRLKQLELQGAAAQALLAGQSELKPWVEILTLFVRNWNAEAARTYQNDSDSSRPELRWDNYGNQYYADDPYRYRSNQDRAFIPSTKILKTLPSSEWLEHIDMPIRLDHLEVATRLLLKVKEEKKSFPLLEQLAAHRRDKAESLVREMIEVWAENNNPNKNDRYRSRYSYFYGYNQVAESIPLTRSRQERNLKQLGDLNQRIKSLKLEESFEEELADAFIQAHSKAEVWRLESMESVFGPMDELDPDTIASLLRRMRINLAGLWPNPKVQQQNNTKRTDKELKAQVFHGYEVAQRLCADAIKKHPDSWALEIQLASLAYEESNYRATLGSHPDHSAIKVKALDELEVAAKRYIATLPLEKSAEESVEPLMTWFYAAIGSPALSALKGHHQPVPSALPKIKAAIQSIPKESRERHIAEFSKAIDQRLPNVGPDLKYRYLESALSIVDDHEEIEEMAKIFQYYRDLNAEIKLDAQLDGDDQIDAEKPFGLKVNLLHTREIEREAGGFSKYLINQNSSRYAYNYGRPTEDYRDKFEKSSRGILEEHFEVMSLTFHDPKVEARTASELGWTLTPYAYFLLKAKGPEVDTIPSLKIDLDFLDTSGSVILPVASAAIPIDASQSTGSRPYRDLNLTMILDERDVEELNIVALDVRAAGHGLMPDLDELIELPIPGLTLVDTEDRLLQVEQLDAETDDLAPLSTHEWRLSFEPADGETLPLEFQFPAVLATLSEKQGEGLTLQRFDDVDLVAVEAATPLLGGVEQKASWLGWLWLVPVVAVLVWWRCRKKPEVAQVTGPELPEQINPISILTYLENIYEAKSLKKADNQKLSEEIAGLKKDAFAPKSKPPSEGELKRLAYRWKHTVGSQK